MAERMVFDDLRKTMGKSLIWAHEPIFQCFEGSVRKHVVSGNRSSWERTGLVQSCSIPTETLMAATGKYQTEENQCWERRWGRKTTWSGSVERSGASTWRSSRRLSDLIEDAYHAGRFVFICGNGGSGANASHLCEDLAKCTLRDFENQKRLKVLSLTDNTAGIMAWANDEGYDRIFVEQLKNLASPGRPAAGDLGLGQQPEHPQGGRVGQRARPDHRRHHRLRRRQAPGAGAAQPARRRRRHGDRRVAAPGGLPLDHRRPLPPDLRPGPATPDRFDRTGRTDLSGIEGG